MSNKKNQNNEKWLQIGNFLLGHEKNSNGQVLCVRAVSGQWSIRWGEDTYVYAVVTRLMGDKNCHSYIEALLTLYFSATMYAHDFVALCEKHETPFINGFCELMNRQTEYEVSLKEAASAEDDEKALAEVVRMQQTVDELERLDENGE